MRILRDIPRTMALIGTSGFLFALGGGCLPDNLFAEAAGDIVTNLFIAGANAALASSGIQI